MAPIRHLNRASKPRPYRQPPNTWRQQPAFAIYTEPSNLNTQSPNNLNTQSPNNLNTQLHEGLNEGLNNDEGLDSSDNEDLDLSDNEGLDSSNDEDLDLSDDEGLIEDLTEGPIESLAEGLAEDLIAQFSDEILSEDLNRQLHESLDVQLPEDQPYQPPFLPKDRAGKSQNLPENPDPVKLFQLFFPVKEIKNIVKQTNRRAQHIDFPLKSPWKPITVTETYHYLGCLIYIGVQSLQELNDHWGQLKSPIAICFSKQ
jgi:hypothetical protein